MLSILVIDDTAEKIKALKDIIDEFGCIRANRVDCVNSTNDAINKLALKQYDLAILDLNIPQEWGDNPDPENAAELLQLINEDEDLHNPFHLLGITRMENIDEKYKVLFDDSSWSLLRYSEMNDSWKSKLRNKIKYLIQSKKMLQYTREYDYDVAIINALQEPENTQLKKVFSNNWEIVNVPGDDSNTYYSTSIQNRKGKRIRCVVAYANQMASTASSILATKIIYNFRPKYLFMTGICASAISENIGYGDILVATEVWDGASGKIKEDISKNECIFQPDYRHLSLNTTFLNIINRLKLDTPLLNYIHENYPTKNGRADTYLRIHTGPMVSMPAVISSATVIEDMKKHDRKLLGIEMETYGIFYAAANAIAPRPLYVASLKSVSDFADTHKADNYQEYSAYTSAALLYHIVINELDFS